MKQLADIRIYDPLSWEEEKEGKIINAGTESEKRGKRIG